MSDWFRLLADMVRLTLRAGRRPALLLALVTVAQAGVIAGIGLSQRKLVDDSTAGRGAGVAVAVLLGAAAYAVSATAGRVRGNLQVFLVGRVRGMQNERTQRLVSSVPTLTHLEHAPFVDRWDRLFQSSQALAAMPWSALNAVVAAAGLAVTVGLLVSVSPYLCLLALLGVPLYAAARRADRLLRDARDAGTEELRLHHRLHDMCVEPESAKELLLTCDGARWSRRAGELWEAAAGREAAARLRGAAGQAGAWVLYAAGFAAALVLVAGEIRAGRTSVGAAVLVVSLATQLQGQLRMVLESLTEAAEAGQVVSHYWWLRRYAAAAARPGAPVPVVLRDGITLSGVSFRYPGAAADVLHDVDVHLPAGGTVAVVGANGAGKSTLIKLLTGMYEPSAGRITVDGVPLPELSAAGWRARLAGVFQDFARLRLRVGETVGVGNVRFVRDRVAVRAAIDRAGAPVLQGLGTRLGAAFGGVEPSLGQWQRLALARSLMREVSGDRAPVCVVLDEPTAALDPLAEHELFRHFVDQLGRARRAGAVTVVVSHRFTTVRMADRIVVLDGGRVVEQGSHAELMAAGGGYAELYRLQERAYR
ncbi:ATP-binding cassette domain-containing protein [Couchioplanes azureus]|uniref:ATP-binding cassette domain-containing protein n=1 Tax=Couchioplanes caeruleus TaxID=56438 RepID=UPI00167083D4|nr:ABC transporter ATP-binding protein [Couchioplanes caeruleus]GGQ59994.1 ABC transporter permease [Couchioplanes caeruleus subsp. azureus]